MENKMTNKVNENLRVDISSREKLKENIDYAKVVVTDTSSGQVISTKRVVLLAD